MGASLSRRHIPIPGASLNRRHNPITGTNLSRRRLSMVGIAGNGSPGCRLSAVGKIE